MRRHIQLPGGRSSRSSGSSGAETLAPVRHYSVPSRPQAVDEPPTEVADDDELLRPLVVVPATERRAGLEAEVLDVPVGSAVRETVELAAFADVRGEDEVADADAAATMVDGPAVAATDEAMPVATRDAVTEALASATGEATTVRAGDPGVTSVLVTPVSTKVTRGVAKVVHAESGADPRAQDAASKGLPAEAKTKLSAEASRVAVLLADEKAAGLLAEEKAAPGKTATEPAGAEEKARAAGSPAEEKAGAPAEALLAEEKSGERPADEAAAALLAGESSVDEEVATTASPAEALLAEEKSGERPADETAAALLAGRSSVDEEVATTASPAEELAKAASATSLAEDEPLAKASVAVKEAASTELPVAVKEAASTERPAEAASAELPVDVNKAPKERPAEAASAELPVEGKKAASTERPAEAASAELSVDVNRAPERPVEAASTAVGKRPAFLPMGPSASGPAPVFRPPGAGRTTPVSMPAISQESSRVADAAVMELEDSELTREVFAEMVTLAPVSRTRPPPPPAATPPSPAPSSVLSSLAIEDEEQDMTHLVYVRPRTSRSSQAHPVARPTSGSGAVTGASAGDGSRRADEDEVTRTMPAAAVAAATSEATRRSRPLADDETPTLLFAPSSAEILLPVAAEAADSSANSVAGAEAAADAGETEVRSAEADAGATAVAGELVDDSSEAGPQVPAAVRAIEEGPADEADDPLIGLVIDERYRLEGVIGSGGMSRVYRATHVRSGGKVAVKIVELHLSHRPDTMKRCEQEARAMMEIQSNHVVRAYDVGTFPTGQLYVVMELLVGETLEHMIKRDGPIPWARVSQMALQVCSGLAAGHRKGIFHRDVKPQNCMRVDIDDNVDHIKLIDFGLARDVNSVDSGVTQEGVILGTPEYMAPELIASRATPDARSDVYALGATMYKLLTGSAVFHEKNALDTLFQHKHAQPRAPSQVAAERDIPAAVDELVLKALAKDPARRFASAEEMAQALRRALGLAEPSNRHRAARERSAPIAVAGSVTSEPPAPGSEPPTKRPVTSPSVVVQRRIPTKPLPVPPPPVATTPSPAADQRTPWGRAAAALLGLGLLAWFMWPPAGSSDEATKIARVSPRDPGTRSPKIPPREIKASSAPIVASAASPEPVKQPEPEPPAATPEPVKQPEPQAVVPAKAASKPTHEFNFRSARSLIAEQHEFLRQTCMRKGKEPVRMLKFHVETKPSGRATVYVDGEPAVRACVKSVLSFVFPASPQGASFDYTLWLADSRLDKRMR